jgi:hypothetical protein
MNLSIISVHSRPHCCAISASLFCTAHKQCDTWALHVGAVFCTAHKQCDTWALWEQCDTWAPWEQCDTWALCRAQFSEFLEFFSVMYPVPLFTALVT